MLDNISFQQQSFSQDKQFHYIHLVFEVTFRLASSPSEDQVEQAQQSKAKVYKALQDRLSSVDRTKTPPRPIRSILPAPSTKATHPDTNQAISDLPAAPVQQDLSQVAKDSRRPAKRSRHENDGTLTDNIHSQDDAQLAQTICKAISEAATQIKNTGIPSWWSDLEKLKPNGASLQVLDNALEGRTGNHIVNVEELDHSCVKYNAGLLYRVAMTWLIRCFLEILRRKSHRPSRATAKAHAQDKVGRQQRLRVGELLIAITIPLYETHGKRAYILYALLAAAKKDHFDPRAASWKNFTKTRIVQLALQIANNLLAQEYDHIWKDIDQGLALDPAEFFAS
ncbi:hypothetical protein LTR56_026252 [Elasticomyces elasticus]|nr:hypothetical protein LTR56_026252 [Elasticomyces elasticus]KAK3619050.1 hypothetical protein LTR22_026127 [Elasticomyces elasticus]KAK5729703.1 hypothetical protein LTS12_027310 [Elasticomyces elasticus]